MEFMPNLALDSTGMLLLDCWYLVRLDSWDLATRLLGFGYETETAGGCVG